MAAFLISDVDGTLVHRASAFPAVFFGNHYISMEALAKFHQFNDTYRTALATGRRTSRKDALQHIFAPTYLIMEHGGVIYREGKPDRDWAVPTEAFADAKECFRKRGYTIKDEGRIASFSIEPHDGVAQMVDSFPGLHAIRNKKRMDITMTTKDAAIQHVMRREGISFADALVLGDDYNDLGLLAAAKWSACPANSSAEVQAASTYISPFDGHEGTLDLLNHALMQVTRGRR